MVFICMREKSAFSVNDNEIEAWHAMSLKLKQCEIAENETNLILFLFRYAW